MTEVRLPGPVKASIDDALAEQSWEIGHSFAPGALALINDPVDGAFFVCPCGCRDIRYLPISSRGWNWNGSRDLPTLTPSILMRDTNGETHWHGFLTAGFWTQA